LRITGISGGNPLRQQLAARGVRDRHERTFDKVTDILCVSRNDAHGDIRYLGSHIISWQ
jgi:hypothetical protein